jgi:hypothetical protein
MVLYAFMCVCTFPLHRESPDMILADKPLISEVVLSQLVKANTTCFNCGQNDHYDNRCPNQRQPSTPTQGTTAPPNHNENSTPTQAKQNYARGRVIQVTIEEAHNAPTMMSDTTLVNLIL